MSKVSDYVNRADGIRLQDKWPEAGFFDSAGSEDYNDKVVNFVVHHILPIFKYLFIVGMLGAVPVIIVTAIKTAQSMFETDESARDHKA